MRNQLCLLGLLGLTLPMVKAAVPVETLPAGTHVQVRLSQSLDTRRDKPGAPFVAHLSEPVTYNGQIILERGAFCRGHVVESKPSGRLKGRAIMSLSLDAIESRGRTYNLVTSDPAFAGKRHRKRNLVLIGGGAGTGAGIGAIAGGGVGALIGAGAGAVAGTTGALITGKKNLHLAPETRVAFTLRRPLTVQ
ncbi:MAG TPA: hypothetical protein VG096_22980 [Bryobacteraceae bacterium]|jgi:hypothetical protein|nr:hypothetical protein [Bryobacteraceae bacterium]